MAIADLWIIRFWNHNGELRFGCRQTDCPEYTEMYKWLTKTSYTSTSDDFPWDYWYFKDLGDQMRFEQIYGSVIRNEKF
jgi:hypothetical protein